MNDLQGQPPQVPPLYQSPSFSNQPTQANPGQFQPTQLQETFKQRQQRYEARINRWFQSKPPIVKVLVGLGVIALALFFCSAACTGAWQGITHNVATQPTPTQEALVQ